MKIVHRLKLMPLAGMAAGLIVFFLFSITACKPTADYVAWVVGTCDENGTAMLLYSDDSGNTWSRQALDILPDNIGLIDLYAVDSNIVWAVGEQGLILYTDNGGQAWQVVPCDVLDDTMEPQSISIYRDDIWISGLGGLIMRSSDNGSTWTVFDDNSIDFFEKVQQYQIQGIHAINHDIIYAVGNKAAPPDLGIVLRTVDGGQSWEDIDMPNDYNQKGWIGVKATDPDHVVIYGLQGHYIVTADGGNQWVTGGPLFPKDINGLVMVSSTDYWAACDFDTIIRTTNSGISWQEQPSAGISNFFLLGIDTLDGTAALIAGASAGWPADGKILRTVDGGQTWEVAYESDVQLFSVAIAAPRRR